MIHFFHKWKVVAAQEMTRHALYAGVVIQPEMPGEPCTQFLEVCTVCKTSRTRSLAGVWTLNDLNGGSDGKA